MFSVCALLLLLVSRTNAELWTPAADGVVDARLVNGDRRCSGHLEIKHQDQWRTLMWESNVNNARASFAEVACRQMDCGSVIALKAHVNTTEPKPAWKVYFHCHGFESTIRECKDAATSSRVDNIWSTVTSTFVKCSDFLRLTNSYSYSSCSGRVTVKSGQNWIHVCHSTTKNEQLMRRLMCAELGCQLGVSHQSFMDDTFIESTMIQCHGNETQLEQCPTSAPSDCKLFVYIDCGNPYSVRAVGESRCRGVVEGKNGVEWRPLTHGWIRMQDDQLMNLCKAMGCGTIISSSAKYFDQRQLMWMMDFDCRDSTFCTRWTDAVDYRGMEVNCTENVRLVYTNNRCTGFVEVQHKGEWRGSCYKDSSPQPFVACRDLGCGFPREVKPHPGYKIHYILSLNCSGQEEHLADCPESSLSAEDVDNPCTTAYSITCDSIPVAPVVTVFSRLADVLPNALHAYDSHRIFITCSVNSSVPVKTFFLKFSSKNVTEVKEKSAVDSVAQFVFEAELNQDGSLYCNYNYEFSPDVFAEQTELYLFVKESQYARLSGRESRCLGSLELEHEGEWRAVSQQQWGLEEAAVVCRQLHCGSAISTDTQSGELQPVWRFFSDCDGSERALLGCGGVRKWMSSTTVRVLCSDIVPPPNITVLADRLYPENTEQVVIHEGGSFFVNCSVEPRFPGGRVSLVFSGSKKRYVNEAAYEYSAVFKFSKVSKDQSGNYSCVYNNTVSQRDFTFESKTVTITVEESGDLKLDDGLQRDDVSKSCSGTLFMKNRASQMKMVTVETSVWDMRHASIVCRQLGCGDAVSTSKLQLQTFKSTWRFFSDCDGSEVALLHCGHIEDWLSSEAVQVVCAGNN